MSYSIFTRGALVMGLCLTASAGMADFTDDAPKYVPLVPITDLVSGSAKSCGAISTLNMPMLDWGADFTTVQANGGVTTDEDSSMALFDIDMKLYVENDVIRQLESYRSCDSPFMRLTQGQAALLAPITEAEDKTSMVSLFKHSWSLGDHLVARSEVAKPADLCTANIAIMRNGPHTSFLSRILSDSGCDIGAMQSAGQIKWMPKLSGQDSPYHALVSDPSVGAAFVVTPDMIDMVDNGHVPGAHNLISTSDLSRVISDVIVVRKDYALKNRQQLTDVVHALMIGTEEIMTILSGVGTEVVKDTPSLTAPQITTLQTMADIFPVTKGSYIEAGLLFTDAELAGYPGNVSWATETEARGWLGLNNEVFAALTKLGMADRVYTLSNAAFDYTTMTEGLNDTSGVVQPKFEVSAVAAFAEDQRKKGTLESGEIFSFEVFFEPDTNQFFVDAADEAAFNQVLDFSQTYGNAIFTVEGNTDPLGFLQSENPKAYGLSGKPASKIELRRQRTGLKSLAASRAQSVMDALIEHAQSRGKTLDPSQFAIISHGIANPKTGMCGNIPCSPATEAEWKSNMRVEFRLIVVPAEAKTFVARRVNQ